MQHIKQPPSNFTFVHLTLCTVKGPGSDVRRQRRPPPAGRGAGRYGDAGRGRGRGRGRGVSLRIGGGNQRRVRSRGSLKRKDRSFEKAMKLERAIERRTVQLTG